MDSTVHSRLLNSLEDSICTTPMTNIRQTSEPTFEFHSNNAELIKRINPYSAGIDFRRQNLTSVDVRFWRLKSIPALKE